MKNVIKNKLFLFALMIGLLYTPLNCYGKEETDWIPVYGKDIKDGVYDVEVNSSSSMFRIVKAKLIIIDGNMEADITLSGTGYLKLFMGTGEEALKAQEESYIPYVEDEEGAYTYKIPVEVLNKEFACAAYSKKKEQWYDRQLVILASSLPEEVLSQELAEKIKEEVKNHEGDKIKKDVGEEQAKIENLQWSPIKMEDSDGNYTMEVTLHGGSGKATIISPTHIRIAQGTANAFLEWNSPNYDYMIVNGKQYFPVSGEGNSVFEIPILALDKEIDVIADTVAMSKPYEVAYTLTFHSDTIQKVQDENSGVTMTIAFLCVIGVIIAATYIIFYKNKKRMQNV